MGKGILMRFLLLGAAIVLWMFLAAATIKGNTRMFERKYEDGMAASRIFLSQVSIP